MGGCGEDEVEFVVSRAVCVHPTIRGFGIPGKMRLGLTLLGNTVVELTVRARGYGNMLYL